MHKIAREITVDARMDKVFDFLANPNNLPEVWPNVLDVKNISPSKDKKANGAFDFDWTYSMSEQQLTAKAQTVEFEQYDRVAFKSSKGLESTIAWKLAPQGGKGTRLTLEMTYEIPTEVANKADEQRITEVNERHVDAMLENLKAAVEAEAAYA